MIIGERIRFRAIERADIPVFVEWINDPEVRAGISAFLPLSIAREELWFDEVMKRPVEEHPMAVEAKLGSGWTMIGSCGLFDFNWRARKAEIGIMIGVKEHWNKGYGGETMRLMMQHGFETLNLHRIYLKVYASNPRAIRSYEKIGFVLEGRMREASYENGAYQDDLIMSVLRPEWDAYKKSIQSGSRT
jgi:RimJ/RimL family protein N-acetyltransferase